MLIDITSITIHRRLLRRSLDPEALRLLAEDIALNGLIQPIAVRVLDPGRYALIAGRRRVEAHKLLDRAQIEAHILDATIRDEIRGAAENIKRVQLSPLEEADIVRDLHDLDGLSIAEIAEQTGHGTSWVQDRLALLGLPAEFQAAIHNKHLSISAGLLLSGITDPEYRAYLLHIAKTNGATVHQVQAWVQDWTARTAMARGDGFTGDIPQPPPYPVAAPQPCWGCDEPVNTDSAVMVRICTDCLENVRKAKADAAAPLASQPTP